MHLDIQQKRSNHTCRYETNPNATLVPQPQDSLRFGDQQGVHIFVIPGGTIEGVSGGVFSQGQFLISKV